jgi:CRP-like cAMP-binding protein
MSFQAFIQQSGKQLVIKKHDHVFMQGEDERHIYFVRAGLLKAYYVSEDGKEYIKSFILPGNTIGSLTATYKKSYCSFNLVALQDSQLIQIPFDELLNTAHQSQEVANELMGILLNLAMKKERREYELLCMPAEERYQQMLQSTPALFDLVTQNDIARYLGITPVALSRIKKRLLSLDS